MYPHFCIRCPLFVNPTLFFYTPQLPAPLPQFVVTFVSSLSCVCVCIVAPERSLLNSLISTLRGSLLTTGTKHKSGLNITSTVVLGPWRMSSLCKDMGICVPGYFCSDKWSLSSWFGHHWSPCECAVAQSNSLCIYFENF